MSKSRIKKVTENIKKVTSFTEDTKELIDATKHALIEAKKLVDKLKGIIDETDFPGLNEIKFPKINLPKSKNIKHNLITYSSSNVDWAKLADGLNKYDLIMSEVFNVDVSKDKSFQRKFNGFYKIRQRPKDFYTTLYKFLEKNKHSQVSFELILTHFYTEFGSIEASFSSKIAATINPNLPVWDSVILEHLKLKKPGSHIPKEERLSRTVALYNSISKFYTDFLKHKLANEMISDFNKQFPEANISDIKKIDLILWQSRV